LTVLKKSKTQIMKSSGRKSYCLPPINKFSLTTTRYAPDVAAFLESGQRAGAAVVCTGKIKHVGSTYVDQWNYLKNLLPKEKQGEAKLTLAAPNWYHLRYRAGRAYPKDVYATDAEYFADIAAAYRAELKILYENGLRNVQIDDPNLACALAPLFPIPSLKPPHNG
jgi:methionine synthase II (cobalamin-independent)